jgi:hypothetical protein
MVRPSNRAGVPVLSRFKSKLNLSRVCANPIEGGSTCSLSRKCRPPLYRVWPNSKTPRKNVPVVITTARLETSRPSCNTTPRMRALRSAWMFLEEAPSAARRCCAVDDALSPEPDCLDTPSPNGANDSMPSRSSNSKSSTDASIMVKLGVSSNNMRCMAALYKSRSAWARGPRTAGPLRRLSSRK